MLGDDGFDTKQFFRPLLPIGAEFCNYTVRIMSTVRLTLVLVLVVDGLVAVGARRNREGSGRATLSLIDGDRVCDGSSAVCLPTVIRRFRPVAFLNWKNITSLHARQHRDKVDCEINGYLVLFILSATVLRTIFIKDLFR